ncbi:MAG: family 78 glycoside hydrolase catalytic domain [Bacteroidetes bacterium]|nr:family 78 glycoside hydrolase catalytic domain [Bacteroidota bacterium]
MTKLIFFFCIALGAFSCTTKTDVSTISENLDGAIWISDGRTLPEHDSLFYENYPAPLFRKEFTNKGDLKKATLLITAAGYFKATVNGEKIGQDALSPAWTDFSKRVYYSEYDITKQITNGENCLGVTLGNGFYNPLPLKMWGRRNMRDILPVGNPAFIAKLVLEFENNHRTEIISDKSWKVSSGSRTKNNVYLGEVYDATLEKAGWNKVGFNAAAWEFAKTEKGPGGEIQKEFFPPVQVTNEIKPVAISSPQKGIYIVDMGVNFTGGYNIKLSGKKGDTITFRFGERIYDDGRLNPMTTVCGQIKREGQGGPGAPAIVWQTDSYIFKDELEVWYSPEFTFHTYRYMEILGLDKKPQISEIVGLAMNSNVTKNSSFSCSSELLNSIQKATERTFLSNLISVQSDCAAREKFGYGGDLNATSESFIYNFDMQQFYRKTIYDWVDALNDSCFVDTAPYVGIKYCGISWESAFRTTQYNLYLYYNNTDIVKELYELDKKWMEKVARLHPNKIVDSGLSDHESLEPVPVQLTGTCHYLQCAQIMEEFAEVMGDNEAAFKYKNLAEELKTLIKEMFWDKPVEGKINRQTLFSTLLYHEIIPEKEKEAAKDSLLAALKNGPSEHFNTGIFGTKYILEALSKSGNSNSVFDVVNSTVYPGWGFMIDQGATTIWETWKESDNTYSNCHPMFGTVTEWFYRWLGGIQPVENYPGFERFTLSPFIPAELEYVDCKYNSPNGEIISSWKKSGTNKITFEIKVPEGSLAVFQVSSVELANVTVENKGSGETIDINNLNLKTDGIELKSGYYNISGSSK